MMNLVTTHGIYHTYIVMLYGEGIPGLKLVFYFFFFLEALLFLLFFQEQNNYSGIVWQQKGKKEGSFSEEKKTFSLKEDFF